MRAVLIAVTLLACAMSTSGCAALVVGYLVGDGMARSDRIKACRTNLQTINTARMAKSQEPFPDQCGG